jgi:hypothetical protein
MNVKGGEFVRTPLRGVGGGIQQRDRIAAAGERDRNPAAFRQRVAQRRGDGAADRADAPAVNRR